MAVDRKAFYEEIRANLAHIYPRKCPKYVQKCVIAKDLLKWVIVCRFQTYSAR